jgi:hypothetical protein
MGKDVRFTLFGVCVIFEGRGGRLVTYRSLIKKNRFGKH